MKKNKYRIQIETRRNGKKRYQVHVGESKGWFKQCKWRTLLNHKFNHVWWYFDNISDAEEAIQKHIEQFNIDYQNEIINVEFKYF